MICTKVCLARLCSGLFVLFKRARPKCSCNILMLQDTGHSV
jgi:hypothetical protein